MKKIIFTTLFVLIIVNCFAQETLIKTETASTKYLIRSTLGSGGISKIIKEGNNSYYVSQSVGQASVIGTFSNKNYTILQGFQQPLLSFQKMDIEIENSLIGNLYPNPFVQSINVVFDEEITQEMNVFIYNLSGSVVITEKYAPAQKIIIQTGFLNQGEYILKIIVKNKQLAAKIIKQ